MPSLCGPGHRQVLEIEYLCPRIAEVCNPRDTCFKRESAAYQVHRLRGTGAYNEVYRMLFKVLLQEFHRRSYPQTAGIRTEEVSSHPHSDLLHEGLVLGIHRVYFHSFLAVS